MDIEAAIDVSPHSLCEDIIVLHRVGVHYTIMFLCNRLYEVRQMYLLNGNDKNDEAAAEAEAVSVSQQQREAGASSILEHWWRRRSHVAQLIPTTHVLCHIMVIWLQARPINCVEAERETSEWQRSRPRGRQF